MAREILNALEIFTENEVYTICQSIANYSRKEVTHSAFDEVLIATNVLQHGLYNPLEEIMAHEKIRYGHLKAELGIK